MRRIASLCCILLVFCAACRDQSNEGFVKVSGNLFIFNYRLATATYVVTLNKLAPIPKDAMAVAHFEDPAGGAEIVVEQKIWPMLDTIALESRPLRCVEADKPYSYRIDILDKGGKVLQILSGSMKSTLDQKILPDRPLVVGPGYAKNPELSGKPSGKLHRSDFQDCIK
jgi:hypothetical protein